MSRSTKTISLLALLVVLLILAACGQPATPAPTAKVEQPPTKAAEPTKVEQPPTKPPAPQVTQRGLVIGMSVHANPAEDLFWGVVQKGARDAAATYGIQLKTGGSSNPSEQAQLVETYVADKVDGIIVSLANPDALKDAGQKATSAGIPVITINSGVQVYKAFGALTHVGQTERVAGQGAGEQFTKAGAKKVLCVIHEEANIGLEERCDGLKDSFKGETARFNVATTGVKDVKGSVASIQDKLTADYGCFSPL